MATGFKPKLIFLGAWKSIDFNGNEAAASLGAQVNEIYGNPWKVIDLLEKIHDFLAREFDIL